MQILAMSLELPEVHGHPNRVPFVGVLTLLGVPSDNAPSGSRGHRVLLTQKAAVDALPSLLGMAICYHSDWDSHNQRQKFGIITDAYIEESKLSVRGYVYGRDFPEAINKLKTDHKLGMSYELADAHVEDMRQSVWTISRATFTGAAVLDRHKAAYKETSFELIKKGSTWQKALIKSSSSEQLGETPRFVQPKAVVWLRAFHWLHQIGRRLTGSGRTRLNGIT